MNNNQHNESENGLTNKKMGFIIELNNILARLFINLQNYYAMVIQCH